MKLKKFTESKWVSRAQEVGAESKIKKGFPHWIKHVGNRNLVNNAQKLWRHFKDGKSTKTEKVILVAGLLYLISPVDAVPDFIPILGWLDDVGVASYILLYLTGKMTAEEMNEQMKGMDMRNVTSNE